MFNNNCIYTLDKKIINICNYEYNYFFNKTNITKIGFSYKIKNGVATSIKCIKVFVTKKIPKYYLTSKDIVPKYYKGIPTDVVESSPSICCSLRNKVRPVTGGYSISPTKGICGGTFGCLVSHNNTCYVLSSNHVLASCNDNPLGMPIVQPSISYGGKFPQDKIANLSNYIPIKFKTATKHPENVVDCAIAEMSNSSLVSSRITFLGEIRGVSSPFLGQNVQKVGSTTELTCGKVNSIGVTELVGFANHKEAIFKNQILTTKITDSGDSGSLLLDNNMNAVGLFMCQGSSDSTANPISEILKELNVNIVM